MLAFIKVWKNYSQYIQLYRINRLKQIKEYLCNNIKNKYFNIWYKQYKILYINNINNIIYSCIKTKYYRIKYLNSLNNIKNINSVTIQSYFRMFYIRKIFISISVKNSDNKFDIFNNNNIIDNIDNIVESEINDILTELKTGNSEFESMFDDSIINQSLKPLSRPVLLNI